MWAAHRKVDRGYTPGRVILRSEIVGLTLPMAVNGKILYLHSRPSPVCALDQRHGLTAQSSGNHHVAQRACTPYTVLHSVIKKLAEALEVSHPYLTGEDPDLEAFEARRKSRKLTARERATGWCSPMPCCGSSCERRNTGRRQVTRAALLFRGRLEKEKPRKAGLHLLPAYAGLKKRAARALRRVGPEATKDASG